MLGLGLLLLVQASAQTPTWKPDIVVVGRRAERALAECLAHACPPPQEMERSLQAATEQFADGRYVDARRTLQEAIRRNSAQAARFPKLVSALHATLATVAEHYGDIRLWRASARNNVLILRQHLGETHLATLREEITFADSMVGRRALVAADRAYSAVQRRAIESGHSDMAAGAAFRRAWLALLDRRFGDAEHFADRAVEIGAPSNRLMIELRAILQARIAIDRGDRGAVDRLATRLRGTTQSRPQLIFAPPIDIISLGQDLRVRFADVGYWIRPNGRTADAEVLRDGGLNRLASAILGQIHARRYVPLDAAPGYPGVYRIDRFTVRSKFEVPPGTRILQRSGVPTMHVVDLTETGAPDDVRQQQMEQGMVPQLD